MFKFCPKLTFLFIVCVSTLSSAQVAYDDEAFALSEEAERQRMDEELAAAMERVDAEGLGSMVKEVKRLAVEGHAQSQYLLGYYFRFGTGVRKNAKRSAEWMKLSAEQRYPGAMLALAEVAISGTGMGKNEKLARELLEPLTAAEWNFPTANLDFTQVRRIRSEASFHLATLLAEGKGGATDHEAARELMEIASQTGSVYASMHLATEYAKGEKVERDLDKAREFLSMADLQAFDSVRRGIEEFLNVFSDPVVEKEVQEESEQLAKSLNANLMANLRALGVAFLDVESDDYHPEFAIGLLELAAEGGDALAQEKMAELYWNGDGVESDKAKARELFKKAAEGGLYIAKYNSAALILSESEDVDEQQKARYTLNLCADKGLFIAQLLLDGDIGLSLVSDQRDFEMAREYAEEGDVRAKYAIASRELSSWLIESTGSKSKYFRQIRKLAKAGYHRAQYDFGIAHYYGTTTSQDLKKAHDWFEKSAEQGNGEANFRLGYMYSRGEGVEVDYNAAARYYRRSLDVGFPGSANNLANLYASGLGVRQDSETALDLYRIAAEDGKLVACYNMGVAYLNGDGVDKDASEGLTWLVKAGEGGNSSAIEELVDYYDPQGATGDVMETIYWLEKAAEFGDTESMKVVALLYQDGIGFPVSKLKSLYWISRYMETVRTHEIRLRSGLFKSESKDELVSFLPNDYEAILLYVELLSDDDWAGYDLETAFEVAKVFKRTKLFAGRLQLAKLHLKSNAKGAKPKDAIRIYRAVYDEAVKAGYRKHAVVAAYSLSKLYGIGEQVDYDESLQFEWMKRAADIGLKRARFHVAEFLWDGIGCSIDRESAINYLSSLSREGYGKATLKLGELAAGGEDVVIRREVLVGRLHDLMESGDRRAKAVLRSLGVELDSDQSPQETSPKEDDFWRPTVVG